MTPMPPHILWLGMLVCGASALAFSAGCGKRASLADPSSYTKPEEPTQFFADGSSARPLVEGVVPRPVSASPGIPYCTVKISGPVGADAPVAKGRIPFPVTDAILRRGQERFDIYCVACHGRTGDGGGIVVERGFTRPPSFYSPALIDSPDSHFFDVISNGKGAMFSYDDRIAPDDRWAIVAYVRALQASAPAAPAAPAPQPVNHGGTP